MAKSGYVLAGFETLATILNNFANRNTKNEFNDNFTQEQVSNFLSTTCHGFLHSFGQNFSGKKKYDKYVDGEVKLYRRCRETGFFDNCTFIADSGGFQASIGRIDEHETDTLIKLYYDFLREHHEVLDRAFILDLPPGPGCKLFSTFNDVYKRNLETYTLAKNLPQEAKDKIIYIHHFRTPRLWEIFDRILKEQEMFNEFQYHATGGIVANMAMDTSIPCIIYILPIIPLLNQAIKFNKPVLKFHILGGANFRDILFYEMFNKVVKEEHGIELEISYDSSGLFKGLMIGRFFHHLGNNGIIKKVNIKSENLDKRFNQNRKVFDLYKELLDKLAMEHEFKKLEIENIYNDETGTFFEDVKVYSMFYMLNTYATVQSYMKQLSNELYPLYKDRELEVLSSELELITRNINQGKITRKQTVKAQSLVRSLDMLKNLDEDYCKYIVNKCLAKNEFTDLDASEKIMRF